MPKDHITKVFDAGTPIDRALADAVGKALLEHKRAGNPVAVWRDGRLVWLSPSEIPANGDRDSA